jgi:hypothetical protein
MGIDLYPSVRKLIASQDGITLTDAIWLKDLNPDRPVSLILVEQQVVFLSQGFHHLHDSIYKYLLM